MSQYQLVPYKRIEEYFRDQVKISISAGTGFNFNYDVYHKLEAMEEMGVLPHFKGILCYDHWKPYFKLDCQHALCNAHHFRELERAWEQDKQEWAGDMRELLLQINQAIDDAGGRLEPEESREFRQKYRDLLDKAESECPPPDESKKKNKRGRTKRFKTRNLLERLMDFETETPSASWMTIRCK